MTTPSFLTVRRNITPRDGLEAQPFLVHELCLECVPSPCKLAHSCFPSNGLAWTFYFPVSSRDWLRGETTRAFPPGQ